MPCVNGRCPVINEARNGQQTGQPEMACVTLTLSAASRSRLGVLTFGATDEFGHKAVENTVNHYDYHATLLHLFGLDDTQLTFTQSNRVRTLLDGKGSIVNGILA